MIPTDAVPSERPKALIDAAASPAPAALDWPALAALPTLTLPAGRVIFDEGQPCHGFPWVMAGRIRVFKHFANGRALQLYRVGPGELCVVSTASLLQGVPYRARAETEGTVEIRLLPPALFDAGLARADFRRFVMAQFAHRLSDLTTLVEAVFTQRLDQRLAACLLAHHAAEAAPLSLTHQQLADELGSVREVVSRLLKQFEAEGWLAIERGRLAVLDVEALQALAGAA